MSLDPWENLYEIAGWVLWFGLALLLLSSFGNWVYIFRMHRKYSHGHLSSGAKKILDERYARGEISQDEYRRIRNDISAKFQETSPPHTRAKAISI